MPAHPLVAFNPLPYFLTADGFDADAVPIPEAYRQIRAAGFEAVHVEVPSGWSVAAYRTLLDDSGLAPAPGYFQAPFSEPPQRRDIVRDARRVAGEHAALGLTRIFIADQFGPAERLAAPAIGADLNAERLDRLVDGLDAACAAMVAEGVVPCLHQHVGTWIETPEETRFVLDRIVPERLLFGPDTGHLSWAGADPAAMITEYRDRVGAVHLKDFRSGVSTAGRTSCSTYASIVGSHLWTEPGRGDVDFGAVLEALSGFAGWYVVEVDIADQPTVFGTARTSVEWVHAHLG